MGWCSVSGEKRRGLWVPLGVRCQMIIGRKPYWEVHGSQLVTYKKKRREKQVLEDKLWFCFQTTMNNRRTWKQGPMKGEVTEWKGELSGWGVRFVLEGVGATLDAPPLVGIALEKLTLWATCCSGCSSDCSGGTGGIGCDLPSPHLVLNSFLN